jgi:putative intracellular protease/amidase
MPISNPNASIVQPTTTPSGKPKKILIIMSDASSFPLYNVGAEGKTVSYRKEISGKSPYLLTDFTQIDQPSGYFLMELAKPLKALLDAGYEPTFASPLGKEPTPDPLSVSLLAFAGNYFEKQRELELVEQMKKTKGFSQPTKFGDISDEELQNFAGVFIPGGHAPLADLGEDPELGRILSHFHAQQKPTAVICHGPWAFLSTKYGPDKEFVYKGYKITSWSDAEEKFMETAVLRGEVPKVESRLREEGAEMVEGVAKSAGSITVDREVVSAANPMGADALGKRFLEMLNTGGRA